MAYVFEDKAACCGCGLCKAACPHQAITMTPDEEGFCYPVIDAQRCTNCGACRRICAYGQGPKEKPLAYYAARHQDADELARSSSGGVFSAIASFVLEQGGVVFGAVFNENWFVIHTHAETWEELRPMHGSKYIPSNIEAVYPQVETLLRQGRTVLFTGTPCQVAAVRKWVDMRRVPQEKLYLMDLVCHSVSSPVLWKEYLQALYKQYGQKPMMINFRGKKLGWSSRIVSVQLADGRDVTAEWAKQLDFFKLCSSQCINRPACYRCPYANEKRAGDFTGGDFVGIEKLAYQAPVEEGVSVFTVNTEKARKLLPRLPLTLMPVTQQQCLQQGMEYAAAAPKGRDAFWALYREKGFDAVVQKYGKLTLEKKLIYHVIVPVCKKLGIYQLAAKIYLKK